VDDKYRRTKAIFTFFNIALIVVILVLVGFSIFFIFDSPGSISAENENLADSTLDSAGFNPDVIMVPTDVNSSDIEPIKDSDATNEPMETIEIDQETTTYYPEVNNEYFSNPGMGWVFRWGDGDFDGVDATIAYSLRSDISWRVLNPEEGVYDWSSLDNQLELAIQRGQQYSFRVYTMIGESFGGHQVPSWVVNKGAFILSTGEPDYSSCVYQEEWGKFVNALINRYDGNPNIAFVDISGYGNFNEWNWSDVQTVWDQEWQDNYEAGLVYPSAIRSLDGMARRRLADMFIGGSNQTHRCKDTDSTITTVSYAYSGFQSTQLVMPYAGVIQSSEYVISQDPTVGFRHDCLGRASSNSMVEQLGDELDILWRNAPIVFETCSSDEFAIGSAYYLLENTHGSVVHNVNIENIASDEIFGLSENLGYRYYLREVEYTATLKPGEEMALRMVWENRGMAPSYPRMGQDFQLMFYLVKEGTNKEITLTLAADISGWMPSERPGEAVPQNEYEWTIEMPEKLETGIYTTKVAIIDKRTGNPIQLAISGGDESGFYTLSEIIVVDP